MAGKRDRLHLARLAVIQTVALVFILAGSVVWIMAMVMAHQPKEQPANVQITAPTSNLVPPPNALPAISLSTGEFLPPDAHAGTLPDGLVAWRFNSGADRAYGPVKCSNDLFIFAGDNGNIYGIGTNGKPKWSLRFPADNFNGLLPHPDGALAWGGKTVVFIDRKGGARTLTLKTWPNVLRYDKQHDTLVTYTYFNGRSTGGDEEAQVTVYHASDGSLAWNWSIDHKIEWIAVGDDGVYAYVNAVLYRGGRWDFRLYKLRDGKVLWEQPDDASSEAVELEGTLYFCGYDGKSPGIVLRERDPATDKQRRSTPLERYASGPIRIGDRHGNIYVTEGNAIEVFNSDYKRICKVGNDVQHCNVFDVDNDNLVAIRDYDIQMFDHTGAQRAQVPLGRELGKRPKGGVVHWQNGILAVFGGELVCFDFVTNSAEMAKYVKR